MDVQIQNRAVPKLFANVSIKAANTLVMHISDQITFQLPYLQDL